MLIQPLTDDVGLELLEPHHAEALFHAVDRNRAHLRRWLGWVDDTRSPDDTRAFIRRTQQQFGENDGFQTALVAGGRIIGVVGHVRVDWRQRTAGLGYWLDEAMQGRGYMTLACAAYLEHAFRRLGMNRVEINAAVDNRPSRGIPERLGFTHEGVVRDAEWLYDHFVDHAVYGLLAREWRG